jgi:hypothetical protein
MRAAGSARVRVARRALVAASSCLWNVSWHVFGMPNEVLLHIVRADKPLQATFMRASHTLLATVDLCVPRGMARSRGGPATIILPMGSKILPGQKAYPVS